MILSYEYIRGLIDGEGCFTFCSAPGGRKEGWAKVQIPTFVLSMHERDKDLIKAMAESLDLKCRILTYKRRLNRDNYNHGPMARIMVRDLPQLKNVIVPLFYKKLKGYKGIQFETWIDKIGNDPSVPERYKLIHLLYKTGFYDRPNKFNS